MNSGHYLASDILECQFGPSTLSIISQDDTTRLAAITASQPYKLLELAYVTFMEAGVATYPKVHQAILDGEPIGKAFRSRGILFYRDIVSSSLQGLSQETAALFDSGANQAITVVVDIYVGTSRRYYARIVEAYAPDIRF